MRNNFDVHEWRIDQVRKENLLSVKDESAKIDRLVDAITSGLKQFLDVDPSNGFLRGALRIILADELLGNNESLSEGWNDRIEKIEIVYRTDGKLYFIKKNGKKLSGDDLYNFKKLIQTATQIDISDDRHIDKVEEFIKGLGIDIKIGRRVMAVS